MNQDINIFSFIKSRVSILDVVGNYVTLKRAGAYWKGRCPFHNERTGSFTISPHRDIFYCFGCHKGGDVIAFISIAENCSQLQAAQYLSQRYNIELPAFSMPVDSVQSLQELQQYTRICSFFASWCHQHLLKNNSALSYLYDRGLTNTSIKDFSLGCFSEQSMHDFLDAATKEGLLAQNFLDAHILFDGKFGLYSPFADRIIFPIKDHLGRTCGFGGRIFKPDDSRPKYYNSQDHVFFNKGHLLFGLDRAKKELQTRQNVFLVEGYMDCIAMVQAGYSNTVATLGTACTQTQCEMLARYVTTVSILYDGDRAGRDAITKIAHLMWPVGLEPSVLSLPAGEDPASFLHKHTNIDLLVSQERDIFRYFIDKLGNHYYNKSLSQRVEMVKELIVVLSALDDDLKQNLLLQQAAVTFDIPFQVLTRYIHDFQSTQKRNNILPKAGQKIDQQQDDDTKSHTHTQWTTFEASLFATIIRGQRLLSDEECALIVGSCNPMIGLLVEKFLLYYKESGAFTLTDFLEILDDNERQQVIKLVVVGEKAQSMGLEAMIAFLWKKEWKSRVSNVKLRLKAAEQIQDHEEIMRIGTEFSELKNKMRTRGVL